MNIAQWLYSTALVYPNSPAIYSGTELKANYHQFAAQACAASTVLADKYHIKSGDRVAVYLPNRPEYLILFYAIWWLGAVIVPINYKLHKKEAAWIIENSQSDLVFTDDGQQFNTNELIADCVELGIDSHLLAWIKDANKISKPALIDKDKLAWLFYTSGTTGRPKGVMLSHENLISMCLCYPMDVDPVSQTDVSLYAAPMSHGAGLYNMIFVRIGASHVVPKSRGFDSQEIFDIAKNLNNLTMFAAPTMVKRMVAQAKESGFNGDGIKTIVLGGGPMYAADLIDAMAVMGPKFAQIYGQGESPMTITAIPRQVIADKSHPHWHVRLASVGTAQSCIEVRIVDENNNDVPIDTCGEVLVRGSAVMQGYWGNPKATAETLLDGWLHTGDIGYLSADGFLTLTDRSKDVIITGGSNVYPREVEEVITQHPSVYEVAVVGAPNAEWGEEIVAFVVCKQGFVLKDRDLEQWCKENMASFKKPKRYIFTEQLPKNNYGKVLKTELRKLLAT